MFDFATSHTFKMAFLAGVIVTLASYDLSHALSLADGELKIRYLILASCDSDRWRTPNINNALNPNVAIAAFLSSASSRSAAPDEAPAVTVREKTPVTRKTKVREKAEAGQSKFTSVYTNLETDLRFVQADSELEPGQDGTESATGPGGYSVTRSYSVVATMIEVSRGDFGVQMTTGGDLPESYGRMLEWRLANGRPFAVILRVHVHELGDVVYLGKKTGEFLVVKGLQGFEQIDAKIDVRKVPRANQAARDAAERGYE